MISLSEPSKENRRIVGIPVKITENYHTCTCIFSDTSIAVVHVLGARNQREARAYVRTAWYPCNYTVVNGDPTQGHAEPFYLRIKRKDLPNGY